MPMSRLYKTPLPAVALSVFLFLPLSSAQAPTPNSGTSIPAKPVISQLHLYRALFRFVADMERDRLADPSTQLANMVVIENNLRKKIGLSESEWRTLVSTSVKVNTYSDEAEKQAREFANQLRQSRPSTISLTAGRATLHKMQLDLDDRVLGDSKDLESAVGSDTTTRIHAYLNGPLAASAHVTPRPIHKKVAQ